MPVTLPPGRARLSTWPATTGSIPLPVITIGIVLVAFLAARISGSAPATTMTSTLRRTSSAASSGLRPLFPPHIGTRWRCSVLLCSQAHAEPPEIDRNGWTHYLGQTAIDNLFVGVSSAVAPRRDLHKSELRRR